MEDKIKCPNCGCDFDGHDCTECGFDADCHDSNYD